MIDIAIKGLGVLHALLSIPCMHIGLSVLALPESEHLSRARIRFVGLRSIFTAIMLMLCAIAAWQIPSVAWTFALISLLVYLPTPPFFRPVNRTSSANVQIPPAYVRYVPLVATTRVVGVLLLALATYLPRG